MENCTNCFFAHNCPDCSKETCSLCDAYVPLTAKPIEKMGDELFAELYGYGASLRIECFTNTDTTTTKETEGKNNVG